MGLVSIRAIGPPGGTVVRIGAPWAHADVKTRERRKGRMVKSSGGLGSPDSGGPETTARTEVCTQCFLIFADLVERPGFWDVSQPVRMSCSVCSSGG